MTIQRNSLDNTDIENFYYLPVNSNTVTNIPWGILFGLYITVDVTSIQTYSRNFMEFVPTKKNKDTPILWNQPNNSGCIEFINSFYFLSLN